MSGDKTQPLDLDALEFAHKKWVDGYINLDSIGRVMEMAPAMLAALRSPRPSLEAGKPYPYPNTLTKDVPKGYERAEAYYNPEKKTVVVLGWPEDNSDHNCDAMGCGSCSHVIARIHLAAPSLDESGANDAISRYGVDVGYFRRELAALAKTLYDRPKDELARYLSRLASVADDTINPPAACGHPGGATMHSVTWLSGLACGAAIHNSIYGDWPKAAVAGCLSLFLVVASQMLRSAAARGKGEG